MINAMVTWITTTHPCRFVFANRARSSLTRSAERGSGNVEEAGEVGEEGKFPFERGSSFTSSCSSCSSVWRLRKERTSRRRWARTAFSSRRAAKR